MNKKELTEEENFTIIEDNRYLNFEVDVADILALGIMPEFETNAERFLCTIAVGKFIRQNGISNSENLIRFIHILSLEQKIIFLTQLSFNQLGLMLKHKNYKFLVKEILKIVI